MPFEWVDQEPSQGGVEWLEEPPVQTPARRPIERYTLARGQRTTGLPPVEPFQAPKPATTEEILKSAEPPSPETLAAEDIERRKQARLKEEMQPTPERLLTRAGLAIGEAGGQLRRMEGGLLGSQVMELAIHPTVDLVMKAITGESRKEAAARLMKEGKETSEKYRQLGQEVSGGPAGDIFQALTSVGLTSAPAIPAAIAGGLPAAATAAGLQSFGSTYADQIEVRKARGESQSEAEWNALFPSLASFAVTTGVTAGFGRTGVEALANGLSKKAVTSILRDTVKQAALEAPEEMLDQIGQDVIERVSLNPEKDIGQTINEVLLAGSAGFGLGGMANLVMGTAGKLLERKPKERKQDALPIREAAPLPVDAQAPPSPQVVEEVRQPAAPPKEEVQGDVTRPEVERLRQLNREIKPLAEKGGLTRAEAERFRALNAEANSLRFNLQKPLELSKIPSPEERQSTIPSEIVLSARNDLMRDKA